MNKKIITGIILSFLLLATIGFTYAFFSAQITGEGTDNIVEAGTLSLHFEDGPEIRLDNAIPGESIVKEFTVTNTGSLDTNYTIWWKNLINEILYDELVLTLECTSFKDEEETGTCQGLSETPVTDIAAVPIKSNISIASGITHSYKMTVTFKEMNKVQNYNQGKKFRGIINIQEYFQNETDVPIIESYSLTNRTLVAKVSDSIGITH